MKTTMNIISQYPDLLDRVSIGSFSKPLSQDVDSGLTVYTIHALGYKALSVKYMQAAGINIAGSIVYIPMGGKYADDCKWKIKFVRYDDEPGLFWGKRQHVDVNGENPFWGCETLHKISDIVDN